MNVAIFFVLLISNVAAFNLPQGLNELDEYVKRTNYGRKLINALTAHFFQSTQWLRDKGADLLSLPSQSKRTVHTTFESISNKYQSGFIKLCKMTGGHFYYMMNCYKMKDNSSF